MSTLSRSKRKVKQTTNEVSESNNEPLINSSENSLNEEIRINKSPSTYQPKTNRKQGFNIIYKDEFKRFANVIETNNEHLTLSVNPHDIYKDIKTELLKISAYSDRNNKYYAYLQNEKIMNSVLILNPKFLSSLQTKNFKITYEDIPGFKHTPLTPILGTVFIIHETKSFHFENPMYNRLLKEKPEIYNDYFKLISMMDDYQAPNRAAKNAFKWFLLRQAILSNNAKILTPYLRYMLWMSAYGNILKVIQTCQLNENEMRIISIWKNILSSFYCFLIFMFGVKPNKAFKGSLLLLISDDISIQLFETALFPISFLFTPFMYINLYTVFTLTENSTFKSKQKILQEMIDCPQIQTIDSGCLVKWLTLTDDSQNTFMQIYDEIRTRRTRVKKQSVKKNDNQ